MIKFRPHHFLCTLGFEGKGYSDNFVENFSTLKAKLTDDTVLTIVAETDDICAPCPHKRNTVCTKQDSISALDARHAEAMGFTPGISLTWGEAKEKMRTLSIEDFHHICTGCSWKTLGICEEALINLRE